MDFESLVQAACAAWGPGKVEIAPPSLETCPCGGCWHVTYVPAAESHARGAWDRTGGGASLAAAAEALRSFLPQ